MEKRLNGDDLNSFLCLLELSMKFSLLLNTD